VNSLALARIQLRSVSDRAKIVREYLYMALEQRRDVPVQLKMRSGQA
jgi:hypothetical protein